MLWINQQNVQENSLTVRAICRYCSSMLTLSPPHISLWTLVSLALAKLRFSKFLAFLHLHRHQLIMIIISSHPLPPAILLLYLKFFIDHSCKEEEEKSVITHGRRKWPQTFVEALQSMIICVASSFSHCICYTLGYLLIVFVIYNSLWGICHEPRAKRRRSPVAVLLIAKSSSIPAICLLRTCPPLCHRLS